MILILNFGFKRKNYSVRISLPGRLEQRARVKERDVQGGAGWPREPGAGDVGRRHHHHTKGFPPANQVHRMDPIDEKLFNVLTEKVFQPP